MSKLARVLQALVAEGLLAIAKLLPDEIREELAYLIEIEPHWHDIAKEYSWKVDQLSTTRRAR